MTIRPSAGIPLPELVVVSNRVLTEQAGALRATMAQFGGAVQPRSPWAEDDEAVKSAGPLREGRAKLQIYTRHQRGEAATVSPEFRDLAVQLWDAWWDKRPPEQTVSERTRAAPNPSPRATVQKYEPLRRSDSCRPGNRLRDLLDNAGVAEVASQQANWQSGSPRSRSKLPTKQTDLPVSTRPRKRKRSLR